MLSLEKSPVAVGQAMPAVEGSTENSITCTESLTPSRRTPSSAIHVPCALNLEVIRVCSSVVAPVVYACAKRAFTARFSSEMRE
eukprot:scaffold389_cov382-Prasinococcus_capsulatus_cf.AAC.29